MKIDVVTLFPYLYTGFITESIIGKAIKKELVEISIHHLRKWAINDYGQVDDRVAGGGAGMLIRIEPVYNALKELDTNSDAHVIALSAKGTTLVQSKSKEFAQNHKHLILLAGHYEGFDQRILDNLVDEEISIGNYVLTGGELPSMVLMDSIVRLIPGVLGNEESPVTDSFYNDDKTIQYPQYTKPAEFKLDDGSILKIPDVLLSGHHVKIQEWREQNSNIVT
jgi:tRNA (guanine37-N1)-methyltransferase